MNGIAQAQRDLIAEFQFFDNWMDRYQYLIDLGRKLPPFPAEFQTEQYRLKGCQSQVWITSRCVNDRLHFEAISDSAIVSGLIALLLRVYNDRKPEEILATPPSFVKAIGLEEHLSPTRSNGLRAMIEAIRRRAGDAAGAAAAP
jgi:cysteine desulfuration protein SufE